MMMMLWLVALDDGGAETLKNNQISPPPHFLAPFSHHPSSSNNNKQMREEATCYSYIHSEDEALYYFLKIDIVVAIVTGKSNKNYTDSKYHTIIINSILE